MRLQFRQQLPGVSLGPGPGYMSHRSKGVDGGGRTDQGYQKSLPGGGGSKLDIEGQGKGKRSDHFS